MKIAVIGSGISGMTAAWLLADEHEVHLLEAADYIGGHTNTVACPTPHGEVAVDTGFIVFNDWTYPNFIRLLDHLGVSSQPSVMSFSVKCDRSGWEYNGETLNSLFAQRRNLLRPSFYRMVSDILRFNRTAESLLAPGQGEMPLGQYLREQRYSQPFIDRYLIPMGAAIWSAEPAAMLDFPARFFITFFRNHGLLTVRDHPIWRVICGGSWKYVEKLTAAYRDRIRLRCPVQSIRRADDHVMIQPQQGATERFDEVVLAVHSDQALALLSDSTEKELEILSALPYQENEAVLHTDTSVLPVRRRAWASWNYQVPRADVSRAVVTYYMNRLQSLPGPKQFCVTLNPVDPIDPARVLRRITYHHPVYTLPGMAARSRHAEISGVNRTHYCGAYWGNGFHEDGVNSALAVARRLQSQRVEQVFGPARQERS